MLSEEKKNRIKVKLKDWLYGKFDEIQEVDPVSLLPNPFLLRVLGIKENTIEAYEFRIRQRLERKLVTSFGSIFQEVLKMLDKEAKIEDIDLVFKKNGKIHYVQLKSGPQGFTRPALRKTKQTFEKLKKQDPTCVTVIGFAYGSNKDLSPIWGQEAKKSADMLLAGKELWDYFLGEGAYEEILSVFEEAGNEVVKEKTGGINGLYETFIKMLLSKIKS
ncbi:MAG: TdeIII family type II restriction endonuclease [Thermacetogeniaceae bacterium]